jgi:hypothetical protein
LPRIARPQLRKGGRARWKSRFNLCRSMRPTTHKHTVWQPRDLHVVP